MKSHMATFTVKNILLGCALVIGGLASTASATAQTHRNIAEANIPFTFHVGTKEMPAGKYTISSQGEHLLLVRGSGHAASFMMVLDTKAAKPRTDSVVVFHSNGAGYFLREIWTAGSRDGLECPKTRAEKQQDKLVGQNGRTDDTIELALNLVSQH